MVTKATIYLNVRLHRAAKKLAAETNRTLSDLIAEGLHEILREVSSEVKAIRKRPSDPSKNIETVLKGLERGVLRRRKGRKK